MSDRNGWSGAITVYLSIILSAVILLSGILMDIVRIKAAEIQVRRAVNTAAASALAGYHSKLKGDYGLFALNDSDRSKLEETVKMYLQKNLLIEMEDNNSSEAAYNFLKNILVNDEYKDVHFLNLYKYRIESVQTIPLYNFTENEITRQQITEYMKYRAPVQFAQDFIDKVEYVSNTADLTDAYKQKTVIEKKLAKVEKALIRLQKDIDELNKFNKNYFDNNEDSSSLIKSYLEFEVKRSVYAAYSSATIDVSDRKEDQQKAVELSKYAAELYRDASRNSEAVKDQLDEHVSSCFTAARKAQDEISAIKALVNSLQADINTLKVSLQELEKNNRQDKPQIITALKQDIQKWEQLVDSENSSSILKSLEEDILALSSIKVRMSGIQGLIAIQVQGLRSQAAANMSSAVENDVDLDITGTSEFRAVVRKILSTSDLREISSSANAFEVIKEVLIKSSKQQGEDPRKKIADSAKEIKEEITNISSMTKRIEEPTLLPSYSINGIFPNKIFSDKILQTVQNDGDAAYETEDSEVDFGEDSSFSENTFGYITYLASKLKQFTINMRNEIYVNEYILGIFKDGVEIKDAVTDGKISDTLFDKGEVEYILTGKPGEAVNFSIVKGKILLIRFGMNTLHVYADPQKRLKALEIAAAAAGLTGFGVPVVHNLIMCSWGMAESFQDMQNLYQGKRVPFIKNAQTWQTDLIPGGYMNKKDAQNQGDIMDFDYHDYLRLLLLVENKDIKMNRVEDLIQLNMQKSNPEFKLSDYNTYLKVNVQVSIKYWFLTRIFAPSKLKTTDGRHVINIEAWKGY